MTYIENLITQYSDILEEWAREDVPDNRGMFGQLVDYAKSIKRKKRNYLSTEYDDKESSLLSLFTKNILEAESFNDEKKRTEGYIVWGDQCSFALSCGPYGDGWLEFYLYIGQGSHIECRYVKRTKLTNLYSYDFFSRLIKEKARVFGVHARQIRKEEKERLEKSAALNKDVTILNNLIAILHLYGLQLDTASKKKVAAMNTEYRQLTDKLKAW